MSKLITNSEIRNMSTDDVQAKIDEYKKQLLFMRFRKKSDPNDAANTFGIKFVKKAVARLFTALNQK